MKLFKNMTIKDAVNLVSEELKLSRKIVYSRALEIKMLVDI
jgi:predicted transcriptional regulator YheO